MVRSEIGGQKAKFQIPDLFPDMEFPNLFHLKEHKILPIRGAKESTKTFWETWINSKQFFKNGPIFIAMFFCFFVTMYCFILQLCTYI